MAKVVQQSSENKMIQEQRHILNLLSSYTPNDSYEKDMLKRIRAFVKIHKDCLLRSLLIGHLTASAWVTDSHNKQVLLLHHRKLDKWLQPGGHADGNPDLAAVAMREASEESGLQSLHFKESSIFDVDIHMIPERKGIPEHLHHDVRFWLEADPHEPLQINHESKGFQWVSLQQVNSLNAEESILRMVRKTEKA